MELSAARARKKQAESDITKILQDLCEDLRPSNLRLDLSVSRLEQWGEDTPVSIMFLVNITCEV